MAGEKVEREKKSPENENGLGLLDKLTAQKLMCQHNVFAVCQ